MCCVVVFIDSLGFIFSGGGDFGWYLAPWMQAKVMSVTISFYMMHLDAHVFHLNVPVFFGNAVNVQQWRRGSGAGLRHTCGDR